MITRLKEGEASDQIFSVARQSRNQASVYGYEIELFLSFRGEVLTAVDFNREHTGCWLVRCGTGQGRRGPTCGQKPAIKWGRGEHLCDDVSSFVYNIIYLFYLYLFF